MQSSPERKLLKFGPGVHLSLFCQEWRETLCYSSLASRLFGNDLQDTDTYTGVSHRAKAEVWCQPEEEEEISHSLTTHQTIFQERPELREH